MRRRRTHWRTGLLLLGLTMLPLAAAAFSHMPPLGTAADFLFTESDEPREFAVPEMLPWEEESLFLSQGFGMEAELAPDVQQTAASADPGPKPYPEAWKLTGGEVVQTTYLPYTGERFFDLEKAGQVQNVTHMTHEALLEESRKRPDFDIFTTGEPQVLIMHTHTTETFEPYERDAFDMNFNYRTTDASKNMVMVGDAIADELEKAGIGVIHDTTIHDYPSYTGSYDRSRATVQAILAAHPSIKVVLDIHRDAISRDGVISQPVVEIDGKKAAQVMIISGCDDGTMGMPDCLYNFRFACLLQQQMESDYPGLTRPILFDYRKYNQDLRTGSLLIEVGSHGNTLEQAEYAGELIGSSLRRALLTLKP